MVGTPIACEGYANAPNLIALRYICFTELRELYVVGTLADEEAISSTIFAATGHEHEMSFDDNKAFKAIFEDR